MTALSGKAYHIATMTSLSGKDFNNAYPNAEFYKLLGKSYKHFDFKYQDGLNERPIKLPNLIGSTLFGGMYFVDLNYLPNEIYYSTHYIVKLTIPSDAIVFDEGGRFKTDKFILDLNKKGLIQDSYIWTNDELCAQFVNRNKSLLRFVKNQTYELCKLAIQQTPSLLRHVNNQTDTICEMAILKDGYALQYVDLQTDYLCTLAVKQNGLALHLVKNQTPEICTLAIQQNPLASQYVRFQTPKIREMAINQNPDAVKHVWTQTYETYPIDMISDGIGD